MRCDLRLVIIGVLVISLHVHCSFADYVLMIGDSISLGYRQYAVAYAAGQHELIHIGVNATSSNNGLIHIDDWLNTPNGGHEWDAIYFNFGLHDITRRPDSSAPPDTPISVYQSNLIGIVDAMKSHAPEATLIFALTTPVLPINTGNRIPEDVAIYNAAAIESIGSEVYISDLYSPMLSHLEDWSTDGTHFSEEGNQFNGMNVVNDINAAIPEPSAISLIFVTMGALILRRCRTRNDILIQAHEENWLESERFNRPQNTFNLQCWEFEGFHSHT